MLTLALEARRVRIEAGLTQAEFGAELAVSPSAVSMYERGERPLPKDIMRTIAAHFGDRRLAMAVAKEAAGGIGPTPLDPARCNLQAVPAGVKTGEELREALAAQDWLTQRLVNVRRPDDLTASAREEIVPRVLELIEAETALANDVDAICRLTGIDPRELYRRHDAELQAKGYIARTNGESRRCCNTDGSEQRSRLR